MKWIGCISVVIFGSVAAHAQPALDLNLTENERAAQIIYETFLASRSEAALSTRRDDDNDAEIERLMSFARIAGGSPEMQARLFIQAEKLAQSRRAGESVAVRISQRFRAVQPGHRWCDDEHQLGLYEQWYDRADRDTKRDMAEDYIILLLGQSVAMETAQKYSEALALNRTGLSVSRAADSVYEPLFEQRARDLAQLRRYDQRLDQLMTRLEDGSIDHKSAGELAPWLAAERSDFEGALAAAEKSGDTRLIELVTLASRPAYELEAGDALAVAQWFNAMSQEDGLSHERARLGAMVEAVFYYQYFLKNHPEQDVLRLRVLEIALSLDDRVAALQPEPIRRPAGPWRGLIGGIAEPRTGDNGNLLWGQHLRVRNNTVFAHHSAFTIPVRADSDYEFRMAITRTHANEVHGISLYFPLKDKGGWLVLGGEGESGGVVRGIQIIKNLEGFRFPEDTAVGFVLAIHIKNENDVRMTIHLDGVEVFDWTGPLSSFRVDERNRPPQSHGNIFGVSAGTTYEFQQIEYRRAEEE